MDLEMPIMGGCDATISIRQCEKENNYQPVFICGMSAYFNTGYCFFILDITKKCIDCGMNICITKPLDMEKMLGMVNEQFNIIIDHK